MEIFEIIQEKSCAINFGASGKNDALKKLAKLAKKSPLMKNIPLEVIQKTLLDREEQGTTGFGDGVAIPHGKIHGLKEFICFIATSNKGIEFSSMDKKKVKIFVALFGPDNATFVKNHLKFLSSISIILSKPSVRKEILSCPSIPAFIESFVKNSKLTIKSSKENKLMQIILYLDEYLYDILEIFIEEDIQGASITESFGMGEYISNIPLFAEFIGFMNENKNKSKTITVIIPKNKVDLVVSRIEEITGDLNKKQGAVIIVQNIDFYKGTMNML